MRYVPLPADAFVMMIFRSVVTVLVLSLSAASLTAGETSPAGGGSDPEPKIETPGPLTGSLFGEVVVGEFTGDLGVDAVVLASGVPTLCLSAETLKTSIRWSGGVAADLVAVASASGPDRLFAVAATGLHELVWNTTSQAWDTDTIDVNGWAGARAMASGDLDGDGQVDLFGLVDAAIDDRAVLVSHGNAAGGFDGGAISFHSAYTARDVVALDWNGDGIDEIVVLSDGGAELFEESGVQVGFVPWVDPTMMITVLDDPAHAGQRLAMVFRVQPGGNQLLVLVGDQGLEGPTPLGSIGIVSLTGADMDNDGDTDLIFGLNGTASLGRLEAHSDLEQANTADPTFVGSEIALVPFGPQNRDPSLNAAGLAAIDFDHDGDLEIFAPSQCLDDTSSEGGPPFSNIFVVDDNSAAELAGRVGMAELSSALVLQPSGNSEIHPLFSLVGPAAPLSPGAGQLLQLQITLWRTPDFWDATAVAPVFEGEFPLPGPGLEVDVIVPYNETAPSIDIVYGWVLRQVVTENGVVVARGPATTGVQAFGDNASLLDQLLPAEITMLVVPLPGGTSTPDGSVTVGTSIPGFEDEATPPSGR